MSVNEKKSSYNESKKMSQEMRNESNLEIITGNSITNEYNSESGSSISPIRKSKQISEYKSTF